MVLPTLPAENVLLASLPAEEMDLLAPELERVDLELRHVPQETEKPATHVWFVQSGVASAVSAMRDGAIVELATIGREGIVGVPEIPGARQSVYTVFMQVTGQADRLSVSSFKNIQMRLPRRKNSLNARS